MTGGRDTFATGVRATRGVWPGPPSRWSYSSLSEAEICPRRWMLVRADYPDLWTGRGYPQKPSPAALFGDVVHAALETILRAYRVAGCSSVQDPSTVAVLRSLGGLTGLVERCIDERLRQLATNPRASERIAEFWTTLSAQVPEMRRRVQEIISRVPLSPVVPTPATSSQDAMTSSTQAALGVGSHPEVTLRADDVRMLGRVDLITITPDQAEIVDYKTGVPDTHHRDQLRAYALLWSLDTSRNPSGRPATKLVVAYADRDDIFDAPTATELLHLAAGLNARIDIAEVALIERPPPARPSPDICPLCPVRQICDEYWASPVSRPTKLTDGDRFDMEGRVIERNGPRSWVISPLRGERSVLLRTLSESVELVVGASVRAVGLVLVEDEETDLIIGAMTRASETFVMDAASG